MNVQVTTHSPSPAEEKPSCSPGALVPCVSVGLVILSAFSEALGLQVAGADRGPHAERRPARGWKLHCSSSRRCLQWVPPGIYLERVRSLDLIHFFLVQSAGFWCLDFKVFSIKNSPKRVGFGFNPSPSSRWFFCCFPVLLPQWRALPV